MQPDAFFQWRRLIVDMDGVLWTGDTPLPGLLEFFGSLRATGRRVILATNNATRTVDQYLDRFKAFGVEVEPDEILTSAVATAQLLAAESAPGTRVHAIGEDGLKLALQESGFELADADVKYVVVGLDRSLDWAKLETATLAIRAGAEFIGANPDVTFPSEKGIVPGNGAILAALESAAGVAPRIVGKPEPTLYLQALERLDGAPDDTLVVGDRLDTDIAGAHNAGLRSLLVLTGVTTAEMAAASAIKPTYILPGLLELSEMLE